MADILDAIFKPGGTTAPQPMSVPRTRAPAAPSGRVKGDEGRFFTPFERKSSTLTFPSQKVRLGQNNGKKPNHSHVSSVDPSSYVKRPLLTEAQKRERKEKVALLRAANRGDIALEDVADVVRTFEKSDPSTRPPPLSQSSSVLSRPVSSPSHPFSSLSQFSSSSRGNHSNPPRPSSSMAAAGRLPQRSAQPPGGGNRRPQPPPTLSRSAAGISPQMFVPGNSTSLSTGNRAKGKLNDHAARPTLPKQPKAKPTPSSRKVVGGIPQPPSRSFAPPTNTPSWEAVEGRRPVSMAGAAVSRKRPAQTPRPSDTYAQGYYDEDDDLDDFIDDGDVDTDWRRQLRSVTGYNPRNFASIDDGECEVASSNQVQSEERQSAMIAAREDAEQWKLIQEEEAAERRRQQKRRRVV